MPIPHFINQFAVVNSGFAVSGTVEAKLSKYIGLWCPVVTSGQMFIQGSFDTSSANFVRLHTQTSPSSIYNFNVGPGSLAVSLADVAIAFPYLRFEMGVVQTDNRTLVIIQKL